MGPADGERLRAGLAAIAEAEGDTPTIRKLTADARKHQGGSSRTDPFTSDAAGPEDTHITPPTSRELLRLLDNTSPVTCPDAAARSDLARSRRVVAGYRVPPDPGAQRHDGRRQLPV